MQKKMIFTVNPATHSGLNDLMKDHRVHFVPLLDVGISINDKIAMNFGKSSQAFLKHPNKTAIDYEAEVWPGRVHFTDYLHPNGSVFWKNQLKRLY